MRRVGGASDFLGTFEPLSEQTASELRAADPRARGFEFVGSRSDSFGAHVVAVPADAPLNLRFVTLYKLALCLQDGRPFEVWSADDVRQWRQPELQLRF